MTKNKESYRKLAERYERVLEGADQSFWDWNLKTNEVIVSLRFATMLGYARGELPGHMNGDILISPQEWAAYILPDDLAKALESIERHLKGLTPAHEVELRFKTKSGEWKWLLVKGRVVERDEHGNPLIMSGTHTDIDERKRVEERLVKLSAQHQLALTATRLGWWHYDPIAKTACYDERYGEIFHVTGSEQPIEEILKRLHPNDLPALWAKVDAALNPADPQPYAEQYRIILPDGAVRWIDAHGMAVFEGEGQTRHAVSLIGTVADITEHKRIEKEKAQLSEQRQIALDATNLGWWQFDPAKKVIYNDSRAQAHIGFDKEAITEEELLRRIHPDDRLSVQEKVQAALSPDNPCLFHAQYRVVQPDGSVRWLEDYAKTTFVGEGPARHAVCLIGTAADITERKLAEERLKESEETFRTLVEGAGDAYFVCDLDGRILEVNRLTCETLGFSREELLRMNIVDIDKTFKPAYAKAVWSLPDEGKVLTLPSHHRCKNGTVFPVEVRISSLLMRGQRLYLALARDTTERMHAEEAQRLAAKVYHDSSEAMMVLDEDRHIIMVNQAFINITGYKTEEAIGQVPSFLRALHLSDAFYDDMWVQAKHTGRFKGEVWLKKKDGEFFAVQVVINTIADAPHHPPNRYVALLSDITDKKRSDDLIWSQANFDTLTGLPNRRFFRDRLEHEVRNARRSKLPLALLFIDLDGFKDVNDTLGHDMGDLLLKEAAERLDQCVRETDTVARLGGDEFTVILSELHDAGNVDRVSRQILRALSDPIHLGEETAYVSASIGITLYPQDAVEVEELIRNADQAMYAAKQSGKNQYHYFTPEMQQAAQRRMRIINDLRGALEADQFEIVYQPIVELSTGLIRKAEALIRWQHPRKGLISPIEFISAAEDTGLIASFGDWVFHEAAKQAAMWREKHHPEFQVSVNISPVQFKREGINPAVWFDHLRELGLPGKGVVVEITEGLLLDAVTKVTDQLLMLRDAGIEVALDDFGTGYSSLAYLKKFDIDYLKIDQTFVRNLSLGSDDLALCEAIIVMAHQLGLKVIAEGVETKTQHGLLADVGCDFAQGYLFSKPLSADDFEQLLNADPFSTQVLLDI